VTPLRLHGQRALVTGGSRSIGRAIALGLAEHGAAVAIHHLAEPDEAGAVVAEAKKLGAEAVAVAVASDRTVAVGVNCSAPQHVSALLAAGRTATDLPFVVYPNAGGVWDATNGMWADQLAKDLPAELVLDWVEAGALLVGGCCGLGPEAVSGIAATLAA
jgi:S-methylmethionine-dependent homocysteine/selenocysteine methylase